MDNLLADEMEERKRAGQVLHIHNPQAQLAENLAAAERLQLLIDALPTPISYIDAKQRYRFVNTAHLHQFKRSREQIVGQTVHDIWDEDAYRKVEPYIIAALAGQAQYFKIPLVTSTTRYFEISYIPEMASDNTVAGFYALAIDITEHERIEQALNQHRLKLERSNQELQQFAYIASHDLREPLRTITSYLKLLEKRYGEQLDAEAKEFIDIAVEGAQRMAGLIDGLLDFSRVESAGREAEPIPLDTVLNDVLTDLHQIIEDTGAIITHDSLPLVLADPLQCRQLLQNLVANALKFRSAEIPQIHLSARPEGSQWIISVRDNGIGIKPQFQQRIFQIFQRLHTRESYPGMGLGLAICQRIVERHGGRIWVESEVGEGAIFSFSLPTSPGERC